MRNKEIKKMLNHESNIIVPDLKENLNMMLDDHYSPSTALPNSKKAKNPSLKLALALAIVLFVFIPLFKDYLSFPFLITSNTPSVSSDIPIFENTYLAIDINPSIELEVDEDKKVVSTRALNKEAMLLLYDCNFDNLNLEDVITEIVTLAIEIGYIDESLDSNALMITTINNDELIESEISELALTTISSYLEKNNLRKKVNVLTSNNSEVKNLAKELGVSVGKYQLISKACNTLESLTIDEAKTMSVRELNEIINHVKQEEIDDFRQSLASIFKDIEIEFLQSRDYQITKLNQIDDLRKEINKIKNEDDFNNFKVKINDLISAYNLEWEFNSIDVYNNKTINIIRSKLNMIYNQTNQDINELVLQYNRQKNEIKKEENNKNPFKF